MHDDLTAAAERLGLRPVEFVADGADFLVLHAEDDEGSWILRMPRREWPRGRMGPERALLALVADRVPVAVPRWLPDVDGLAVYRRLEGGPADEPHEEYFEEVARFLVALHAIPVEEAAATGVQVRGPAEIREMVAHKLHRARHELGLSDELWHHWQEWLTDDEPWPDRSYLVHADIKPANTLVHNGKLSGVIDWTDSMVGDAAADFRRLHTRFGKLDDLAEAYTRHGGELWPGFRRHVLERVRMAPIDSGLYGIDSGQDRYVRKALDLLSTTSVA